MGPFLGHFGSILGHFGSILGHLGSILRHFESILRHFLLKLDKVCVNLFWINFGFLDEFWVQFSSCLELHSMNLDSFQFSHSVWPHFGLPLTSDFVLELRSILSLPYFNFSVFGLLNCLSSILKLAFVAGL